VPTGGSIKNVENIADGKSFLNTIFRVEKKCRPQAKSMSISLGDGASRKKFEGLLGPDLGTTTSVLVQRVMAPLVVRVGDLLL
jgi:hypothetical protein